MSRHRLYQNYDYEKDLDEFDGEGGGGSGEEELGPEDQVAMAEGTAAVRKALGVNSVKVTTTQIQDALWHYYYDVSKSVTFLTSKFISPPAPKLAKVPVNETLGGPEVMAARPQRRSFTAFFHDMPWLNVPEGRKAVFIPPPRAPGGLLGGSEAGPRMSKLQALAAARRQKLVEKKTAEDKDQLRTNVAALSLEDEGPQRENTVRSGLGVLSKRRKVGELAVSAKSVPMHSGELPVPEPAFTDGASDDIPVRDVPLDGEGPPAASAPPSAFAVTLFGSDADLRATPRQQAFVLPYHAAGLSVPDAFSTPSPDDIVLAAQAQATKQKSAASAGKRNPKSKTENGDSLSASVQSLKVEDAPRPESKNLDVIGEYERSRSKRKKSASFVVVGHVDAGKSTLMGRLLLDLGVVDQRTVLKYKKEAESIGKASFALAWILDQRSEERSRGVTIDIATNRFETATTAFTILDAPGHKDFIPNMIAGASQADFAVLVVDSSTGAFESGLKGQTREHALLIRSIGVSRVIVAVNKLDTTDWDRTRYDEICQQVSGFLSATGFQPQNISFVPLSGLNGDNLVRKSDTAAAAWYSGPTLIEELEDSQPQARALHEPLRMTISEVYRTATSPLVVSGRLDAGSVQSGDEILVQPSGEKAYVKALELDSAEPVDWAVAGQNAVVHLTSIDPIHVRVGDVVCDVARPIACVDTFSVKVLAFDILMPMQVDVHRGRLHAPGQISELSALLNKTTGVTTKSRPKIVKAGATARVKVKMATKVPLEAGQRVVLRSNGATVAAGLLE